MSQENLIQSMYKAWREDDVDALLETVDPDVVLLTSASFPDLDPAYRGHDGIRTFWDAMRAPWDWFSLDVGRLIEKKDCAVFVVHFRARGQGSGVMTDLRQGHAAWFRNGRVVKLSTHKSFEQALEAAGLSEQDAHADS